MGHFSLIKTLSALARLAKSGQFKKLEPWMLELKGSGGLALTGPQKTKVERLLLRGKLDPKDIDTIIANRNLHLNNALLQRADLSREHLAAMLSHSSGFEAESHQAQDKRTDLWSSLVKAARRADPDGHIIDEIAANGSAEAINNILSSAPRLMSGRHLFKLITERKDLKDHSFANIVGHDSFDHGHMAEVINHPNPLFTKTMYSKKSASIPDSVTEAALTNPNPAIRIAPMGAGWDRQVSLSNEQIKRGLGDPDDNVAAQAAIHIKTPELIDHVLDNHLGRPAASKMLSNILRNAGVSNLSEDRLRRMVKFGVERAPEFLNQYALNNLPVPDDAIRQIMTMPHGVADRARWIGHKSVTPDTIEAAVAHSVGNTELSAIANSAAATPEQIRATWNKVSHTNDYSYQSLLRAFFGNSKTPTDVLSAVTDKALTNRVKSDALAAHANLSTADLLRFISHEDPEYRAAAAKNPNAADQHVLLGLKDKDKEVRAAWIDRNLTPGQLAIALKDRAPTNRVAAVKNSGMTPDLISHILKTDKSEEVRAAALRSPHVSPAAIDIALKDPSEAIRSTAVQSANLTSGNIDFIVRNDPSPRIRRLALGNAAISPETLSHAVRDPDSDVSSAALLHHALPEPDVEAALDAHPTLHTARIVSQRGNISPAAISKAYNICKAAPSEPTAVLTDLLGRRGVPDEILRDFAKTADPYLLTRFLKEDRISAAHPTSFITPALLGSFSERLKTLNPSHDGRNLMEAISDHPAFAESAALQDFANHEDERPRQKAAQHKSTPPDILRKLIDDPDNTVRAGVAARQDLGGHPDILSRAMSRATSDDATIAHSLLTNTNIAIDDNILRKMWDGSRDDSGIHAKIMRRSDVPESIILLGLKHADSDVKDLAGEKIAHHKPDMYNESLDGGRTIELHPATEKLKHLKGQIQEAGGSIHKKDLENGGQGLPGQLFDGKGMITGESIDRYLKSMPHAKYNVSYSTWRGAQRHDPYVTQQVLQLNMTDDHIRQIKEQGLFPMFAKIHELSHSSGHPVRMHTLGWARLDNSEPGHTFIDEVQSDFGQRTVREMEKIKSADEATRAAAERRLGGIPIDTAIDHMKKITKIFSGPFKTINHAIFGAVHQAARDEGITSTSMDMPDDQRKQSGMQATRELPGHMQHTYIQLPEAAGYEVKPKKEVMPNTRSSESEAQYRKLVKSLAKLNGLTERLKSITSDRHTAGPGEDATGITPHPQRPANKPHIRADTQAHLDLKLEKADTSRWNSGVDAKDFGQVHTSPTDGTIMVQAKTGPLSTRKAGDGSPKTWHYFHFNSKTGQYGSSAHSSDTKMTHDIFEKVIRPHLANHPRHADGTPIVYVGITNPNMAIAEGKPNPHFENNPYLKEERRPATVTALKPKGK